MRHRGTLFAGDDTAGIKAVFVLEGDQFSLEVDGEQWADWHVSLISLAETAVNEFQFSLDGDTVRFIPDRRLDFAYGAIPAIKKAQESATKGFRARRKTKKAFRNASSPGRHESPAIHPLTVELAESTPAPSNPSPPEPTEAPPAQAVPAQAVPAFAEAAAALPSDIAPETVDNWPSSPYEPIDQLPTAAITAPGAIEGAATVEEPPTTDVEPPDSAPTVTGELVIDLRTADLAGQLTETAPILTSEPAQADLPPITPSIKSGHQPSKREEKPDTRGGLRLLDRVRQARAEHVHDYEVSSSGVMVRRVCSTCNHVSIGTSD